jgi:hypothetical protein
MRLPFRQGVSLTDVADILDLELVRKSSSRNQREESQIAFRQIYL